MNIQTTAHVKETKDSLYSVDIEVSGHHLVGDEPESYGSKNLGPAPYDLLTAALAECTAMTIRWYAEQQKWPLEHVDVTVAHEKQDRVDVFTKQITVVGPQLTVEQEKKLHDVGVKCPVHRTLMSDIVIETL